MFFCNSFVHSFISHVYICFVTLIHRETGGEYVKKLIVKNTSRTKTQKIVYKLPDSKIFSMKFPEPMKLSPGMSAKIDVAFRPVKRV